MDCECEPDEVTTHFGWFRCTPESRAMLAEERIALAIAEEGSARRDDPRREGGELWDG